MLTSRPRAARWIVYGAAAVLLVGVVLQTRSQRHTQATLRETRQELVQLRGLATALCVVSAQGREQGHARLQATETIGAALAEFAREASAARTNEAALETSGARRANDLQTAVKYTTEAVIVEGALADLRDLPMVDCAKLAAR